MSSNGEKFAMWKEQRQKQFEQKVIAIKNDENLTLDDKEQMTAELRQKHETEEDWRGFYLPKDLNNSVLITRAQLL